ncbi:hypothetical protein [Maribacter sp. 2308TA10-17]|uniref:hypothetical protein n=1 Tax=Maribacter sp. 2308TA10-17 TaxID=3386276 RepID=UPI0039BCA35C
MVQDIVFFITDTFREYFSDIESLGAAIHFIQTYKESGIPDKKRKHHYQAERENDNQQ